MNLNIMKFLKYVIFVLVLLIIGVVFCAIKCNWCLPKTDLTGKNCSFENDICLPSKLYMLSGVQNDVFIQPLLKRWRPYNDVVRFTGSATYSRRLQGVSSILEAEDSTFLQIDLINLDRFDTIKSITSEIVAGEPGVGIDTIHVSIIGDSFTNGAFFADALLKKGYVPGIQMVGLRDVSAFPGQFDEGRGGWALATYFSVSNGRTEPYNGFWQPGGDYSYWGSTHFWILANDVRLHPEDEWSFEERYFGGRFETYSVLFDVTTGYKHTPAKYDMMYDNELGSYVEYDGSSWVRVSYEDYSWNFSYGKYLAMWDLDEPLILAEFLGLNDFHAAPDPVNMNFTNWNSQMERLVASYLEAVPEGKFVIMIPSSSCGILDNAKGDFTTKHNAAMWELRRNIIETFDKRDAESIYVLDAAIAIDNLSGTLWTSDLSFTKPFSEYAGSDSICVQKGNPHPYMNYPSMGVSLAAFIQKYR